MHTPSEEIEASNLRIHGRHFVDDLGRVIQLRGANVSGISKVPSSDPAVDILHPAQTSYINRPFPLSEAPTHWRRLKRWGLTYIRITITWEAIEHAGPGIYDFEYLDYLRQLLESMTEHGLVGYVCLHQDVWSRHCGGSGAPAWTLETAGFDISNALEKLEKTGAAYTTGIKSRGKKTPGDRGLWPTGYQKLACATMNTLFWGGKMFAPGLMIDDPTAGSPLSGTKIHIQDFLQARYFAMFQTLVSHIGDIPGVLGFEMMNEPHPGYIGMDSLHTFNYNTDLHLGEFPSPLQSFALGDGHAVKVPIYVRSFPFPTRRSGSKLVNEECVQVWKTRAGDEGSPASKSNKSRCIWAKEGVWAWDNEKNKPVVLKDGYFSKHPEGRKVDFYQDFYWPFVKRWEEDMLIWTPKKAIAGPSEARRKMIHVEGLPNEFCPKWPEDVRPDNLVFSPHWYDLHSMFTKKFGNMTVNVQGLSRGMFIGRAVYFGKRGVKENYALQIRNIVDAAHKRIGEVPIVFGECGIPIDLNDERAFHDGDFRMQGRMMDALISALESSLVGFNLWTYSPANRDDIGDDWNNENFSWFGDYQAQIELEGGSKKIDGKGHNANNDDDEANLDAGARLLREIARPYALKTAGIPIHHSYDCETLEFLYRFANPGEGWIAGAPPLRNHPAIQSTRTVIFLPPIIAHEIKNGNLRVEISDGIHSIQDQQLLWDHEEDRPGATHTLRIVSPARQKQGDGSAWAMTWQLLIVSLVVVLYTVYKEELLEVAEKLFVMVRDYQVGKA